VDSADSPPYLGIHERLQEGRMRKLVIGVLMGALALTGAVTAWAVTSAETTVDNQVTVGNKREGTRAKPRPNSFVLRQDQATTTGSGQPATTDRITLVFPRRWILISERWPRRRRCDIDEVNQAGSDSSCPRGARIGGGVVNLLAGGAGQIKEVADLRVWVTKTGDIMIFLDSRPGQPVELNAAVPCTVSQRRRAVCDIPPVLERPAGVPSSIDNLRLRIAGFARIRGKRRSILQTTGCRRAWTFVVIIEFDDNETARDSDRVRC
jgi:hypothetical protein